MASKYKTAISKVLAIVTAVIIIVAAVIGMVTYYSWYQNRGETSNTVVASWSVVVNGTSVKNMTESDFETLAAGNPQSYVSNGATWAGTPLHRVIQIWALDNGVINSSEVANGYLVKVIGSDGSSAEFNVSQIYMNTNIILANTENGLKINSGQPYYPLYLTGSDLTSDEQVKGVAQIQILPLQ